MNKQDFIYLYWKICNYHEKSFNGKNINDMSDSYVEIIEGIKA